MKHFFGKYGFTILSALVICALLVIVSPLGKQIGDGIKGQADSLGTLASTSIDYVGIPSASTLGFKPKDIVEIGGKNYVILQDRGSDRYLVMDINGIGNREFNTDGNGQHPNKCALIDGSWKYDTCNNQYEGSNIDQYLNNEYYNSLPSNITNAIVNTNIQQNYYSHVGSNPNYKWVNKGDMNFDGCNNAVCVLQPNGKWVPWYQHAPIKGEMGASKYNNQGDTDDFGNKTIQINRKVFLPSIDEVSAVVNVNDQWEVDKFLRNENGGRIHMWFRDSRDSSRADAMYGDCNDRSLNEHIVRHKNITVRPCFVIDLKTYTNALTN